MLLLPKKVGSYTLQRKLGTGGVAESYVGTHDTNGGKPVVVRRVLPYVQRDPARLASIDGRVKDLLGVRHPFLVHVLESFNEGEDHYLVEEHVDGVNLDKVLAWCRQHGRQIPHNVFLNIATQVCNGLEALHGRTGKGSSAEHVLHLALKPNAIFITRDGKVMVGGYGLTRSPTTLPHGGVAGPVPTRMEYLSPEQTHPDQKLSPSSDIFSLGAVLYELLTLDSLFRADSNLQTIHRVRRAEVTSQLLRVKELMPGLDKVLYRALSLNPRHRYQRAFVLREDLRGLMAGYSFATIAEDTRSFLGPLLDASNALSLSNAQDAPADADSFAESPITHVDLDPMTTAAVAAQAIAAARAASAPPPPLPPTGEFAGEHTENTSPRGNEDPPTEVRREPEQAEDLDRPTLPGTDFTPEGTIPAALRYAPPDPTVSQPDLNRIPPPPPLPIAPRVSTETLSADRERTEREQEAPPIGREWRPLDEEPENTAAYLNQEPESTAAHIAREAPSVIPLSGNPSPSDTAAYLVRDPVAPSAPEELAASPALPPPPIFTPPPAPPAAGFSRPMPGPSGAFSRAMPPPGSSLPPTGLQPPPKPVAPLAAPAAPVPAAAPPALPLPLPAAARTPTAIPEAASAPPRPAPAPPPIADPLYDEPPSSGGGKSWLFAVGGLAALVALFACSGVAWMGWQRLTAPSLEAEAPVVPEAAPGAPADAASIMADAAPPRVEPIVEDAVADATPEVAPAPAPEPTPAAPPAPVPAATPTEPVRTAARTEPGPSPARVEPARTEPTRTEPTRQPATTSTRTASTTPSREPATTSTRTAVSAPPPATSTRTTTSAPATPARTQPVATSTRTATPTTFEPVVDVSVEETPASDLDQFVDAAKKGKLATTDVAILEGVDAQAPDYTRSRALLLMNAQRKGDDKATRSYLDQLMVLPENQYNPVYLTDYARWHVNHAEYDKALDKASLAERYWARIPPELVFSKKAEIYEIQAAAWQGKFYKSDEDMDLLGSAIKGWERYRQHVSTKSRTDLQKRADTELARLQDIREKLQ